MSDKKRSDEPLIEIVVLNVVELSGSDKNHSINVQEEPSNTNTNVEVMLRKSKKNQSLIIPIKDCVAYMSPNNEKAYSNYKLQQFPEIFDIKGLEDDKASEVPFLALTRSTRFFVTLLEAKTKEQEQGLKNKMLH